MVEKANRLERLQVMLDPEELAAIDDWRFARRMPTRAAAVRELLKRGLVAEGFAAARAGEKSSSFGVMSEKVPPPSRVALQSGNGNASKKL